MTRIFNTRNNCRATVNVDVITRNDETVVKFKGKEEKKNNFDVFRPGLVL